MPQDEDSKEAQNSTLAQDQDSSTEEELPRWVTDSESVVLKRSMSEALRRRPQSEPGVLKQAQR